MRTCSLALSLSLATSFATSAGAVNLYVTMTGDDAASCSSSTPCRTIQRAVTVAVAGDVINVAAGTYAPVSIRKDLTILGSGPASTVVDAQGTSPVPLDVRSATVTVRGVSFINGLTSNSGGGLYLLSSKVNLTDCHILDNRTTGAAAGGGVYSSSTDLTLYGCLVTGNRSGSSSGNGGGGGISVTNGSLVIDSTTVSNNIAGSAGAGLYCTNGTAVLSNSTFSGHSSAIRGGAIRSMDCDLTLVNTTLSGNSADLAGGGVNASGGSLSLINATITGNTVRSGGGGGIYVASTTTATMHHTLIAHNDGPAGPDCDGIVQSDGYNLLLDDAQCLLTGDLSNNLIGTEPRLDILADNGGRTKTHALLAGSPAIDGGDPTGCRDAGGTPLARDQRGHPRPFGLSCDIGALEEGCTDTIPPAQGNVLWATRDVFDVRLTFPAAPATQWRIYRDPSKLGIRLSPVLPDVTSTEYVDPGAISVTTGSELFYSLRGLSPCTATPGP